MAHPGSPPRIRGSAALPGCPVPRYPAGAPFGRGGSPGAQRSFPRLGFPLLRLCRSQAGQSPRRECMPHFYQKQKRKQQKYPPFFAGMRPTLPRGCTACPGRATCPGRAEAQGKRKMSLGVFGGWVVFLFFCTQRVSGPLPVIGWISSGCSEVGVLWVFGGACVVLVARGTHGTKPQ